MLKKIVVIMAHPNMEASVLNKNIKKELSEVENIVYKDLTSLYGDFKIDIEKEQDDIKDADKIVFQFPMQWYSSPAILKQYVDEVFSYGFVYEVDENGIFQALSLKGKEFQMIVTMGAQKESFEGEGRLSTKECLNAFSYTAKMLGMNECEASFFYGAAYGEYSEHEYLKMSEQLKENIL